MRNPENNEAPLPIARVFKAKARPGRHKELLRRFREVSSALVVPKQGLLRYAIYEPLVASSEELVFESVWSSLESIREAFGEVWMSPHLPEGYGELIESSSVTHYLVEQLCPGGGDGASP